ncbi:bifunctional 3-deoxy-7-phosphoheptulonate synthase/chorismate mutase [Cyclobacterium qasimii]|uniref:2-keto-3-deoxy-D-arabino-heptulosonate-7-phosphate synthase I beta n=2 Tax=Cyclobacterium qasimii TaxID=1350429 RepID=S7X1B2_9BACT|nr:bifunctional 3-deoxy-7-phosphoheptulonate synthase/chorismate mutase [Cyclobacterium qasimii]EPR69938.1 2-keto-3-deoxy-D-arabino-heptulosonate-7- phosphate synthase I beta [Cyclobacterium qasimii M12-11B]GEO20766.1 3-deoxy-7-phosphoheptulonate synthase [Cyclobacterium qasimii]
MIIQLNSDISTQQKENLVQKINGIGYKVTEVKTQAGNYLIGIGKGAYDIRKIGSMDGILDIHVVSDEYKLVSKKWKAKPTTVDLGDGIAIKDGDMAIISGPCSIESEEQIERVIAHLKENNVTMMRGGVFKPRSSPYAFRGLGMEGLKLWHQHAKAAGIKIVTEVMQVSQIEEMHDYVDVFQVGARNTQNFNLLDELGKIDKAVLLKRGISGTIEELLQSAEYVFSGGNEKLILCERGIRTYERASRNTLDLNAVPILKSKSHLPVVVDPSHGIGIRDFVPQMALAGVMAGADGIIYESHEHPDQAYSDGQQTLNFTQSSELIGYIRKIFEVRKTFDLH